MRSRLIALLVLLLAVLPVSAAMADDVMFLELTIDCVPVGSVMDYFITTNTEKADLYRFTMLRDGKKLFETETEYSFGSYLPRETGEYTLKVETVGEGPKLSSSADFTVVEALTLTPGPLPDSLSVGDRVEISLKAEGGTPPYRFTYAVTQDGQTILEQLALGNDRWLWTPVQPGEYTLHMDVTDSEDGSTTLRHKVQVEENEGISLSHNGGALLGHGGQKSWMVSSGGDWTAETTDDFFRIETPSGQPGDSLVVTALSATDEYRQGSILITSGDQQLSWPVSQSAQQGVDEEVFLFSDKQPLYVDGQEHALWTDASGSRSFTVSAGDAPWTATTDSDFIMVDTQGDSLTVTVYPSSSGAVRSGTVTLTTDNGSAYLHVYQLPGETSAGQNVAINTYWEEMTLYSQFSGRWKDEKYGVSTLEHSGCAIFALAHALEWLGIDGDNALPPALAKKYAFCLRDGGTINSTLIGNAGDDFGFKTRYDLYTDVRTIRSRLDEGAVFSFAVVNGHIALVVEKSEDGSMMRIIDSAPSATWERIKGAQLYRQEDGEFIPIQSLKELEHIRYYVENNAFGGTTYWLEDSYVARRGVRLIQLKEEN